MTRRTPQAPVEEIWQRLERALADLYPKRLHGLNDGAESDDIKRVEALIEAPLPEEFQASLRLHDGQRWENSGVLGGAWELLSAAAVVRLLEMHQGFMRDAQLREFFSSPASNLKQPQKIKPFNWNGKWVPIADNSGDMHMIDLDPAEKGEVGQILLYRRGMGPIKVIAGSYSQWLESYAERYEKKLVAKENA